MRLIRKLIFVIPHLGRGGQERIAIEAAELLRQDFDVYFVIFQKEAEEYVTNIPIHNLNLPAVASSLAKLIQITRRNLALRRYKRKNGVDISLSVGDVANASNAFSRRFGKTLLWVHGYSSIPVGRLRRFFWRMVHARAENTLCVSRQIARDLGRALGLPQRYFTTLYNGLNLAAITAKATAAVPGVPNGPYIAAVGRLEEVKGYSHLLNAFALVHRQIEPVRLVLVGSGSQHGALAAQAKALGLSAAVVFAGLQDNPFPFLANAQAFVLSSYTEGFPTAMIEAMACGVPVVSVACPSGPAEILSPTEERVPNAGAERREFGILTPPLPAPGQPAAAQEQALADGLLMLLRDGALRSHYAEKAKERAQAFSAEAFHQGLLQLLCGGQGTPLPEQPPPR